MRRPARQRQAMQSFPSTYSDCGSIEFARLFDSLSLRALRLLDLLANNPRRVRRCWIGIVGRRWQMRAETRGVRGHMIYLNWISSVETWITPRARSRSLPRWQSLPARRNAQTAPADGAG